jgi:hypothetical protein
MSAKPRPEYGKLQERWTQAFGSPAPKRARAPFLQLAVAWHTQMQANEIWRGTAGMNRLLRLLRTPTLSKTLSPGTRLVREWQGQTHQVTVLDKGFEYAGQTYASLSAIARHITGTPWSGPLFFGLKS